MALVPFPGPQSSGYATRSEEDLDEPLGAQMSFLDHLDELRKRIIRSCLAIGVGIVASFAFIDRIFNFILTPTRNVLPPGVKMIYTQPGEAFGMYINISLIAGAVLAAPFVMYQVWLFIAPGLYSNEKRMAIPFVLFTTVGFLLGASFNHYVGFPFIMRFFASFNGADLAFFPRLQDTFGLYTKMLLGMGIIFQLPTVVFFLAKMKVVTARFLWRHGKYAVLVAYLAAAVLTPTGDPWNQSIFAVPMIALYFFSILIAWIVNPGKKEADEVE
jgi:sec-independent protein translocase protein TatC